ncbi:MAG: ketoacyl-ACP synthase III [Deltaproteobacteria bacterium]|nr:ketoacyl-ACP synthase III [Deltaproteobacteria bacterium]
MYRSRIIGTGSFAPQKVLANSDLEKLVETSDDWIMSRTGIKERRIASNGESTSLIAYNAACKALEMAGVTAEELDLIIVGTITPEMSTPSVACLLQDKLNASRAVAFDISAACAGFIYGLSIADNFIKNGVYAKVLVLGVETLSKITDYQDRSTCILFGDGGGAVVLTGEEGERGIMSTHIYSNGSYGNLLYAPQATAESVPRRDHFLRMDGNRVFKVAVRSMEEAAVVALEHNGVGIDDIDLLIPHQANSRIIKSLAKRLALVSEKIFVNIERYGNTSAASVPIALDEANRQNRMQPDDLILLDAFGAGFTWGSALVRW